MKTDPEMVIDEKPEEENLTSEKAKEDSEEKLESILGSDVVNI